MLDPVRPVLIHPDAAVAAKWKGGGLFLLDEHQQYILRLSMYTTPLRVINTGTVKAGEVSWKGLLDPKFKGKISSMDPRGGRGAGAGNATYILHQLGEEYFTRLYVGQQIALAGDDRQQADWLGRGIYPIAIGLRKAEFATLKKDGFPVTMLPNTEDVPGYSTAGGGYVGLVNRAPHPNAAKLFINWLITQEGHEVFNRALGVPGIRSDLEYPWVFKETLLQTGWRYLDTDTRDFKENLEPKLVKRMKELLSR
jgi:iron(III) transport system substrate-binding protein